MKVVYGHTDSIFVQIDSVESENRYQRNRISG